jgi:hypothetical protein
LFAHTHPLEHGRAELDRHVVLRAQVFPQLCDRLVCLDVGDGIAGVEGLLGQVRLDLNIQLLALVHNGLDL